MNCTGKTAIVCGASGNGMGRSIALTLSREGADIDVNYLHNREKAEEVAGYIRNSGGKAAVVQGDIFTKDDCAGLVRAAEEIFGKVDICVIGPGANWNPEKLMHLNQEEALGDTVREVSPVYYLLPPLLKSMEKRKWGRIIGIASNMEMPSPSYAYNAAKSARIGALRMAAGEAWKIGVTVNTVAPGPVDLFDDFDKACAYSRHGGEWAARKKISPQDIAESVAFLCSDAAKYITGCVLPFVF